MAYSSAPSSFGCTWSDRLIWFFVGGTITLVGVLVWFYRTRWMSYIKTEWKAHDPSGKHQSTPTPPAPGSYHGGIAPTPTPPTPPPGIKPPPPNTKTAKPTSTTAKSTTTIAK